MGERGAVGSLGEDRHALVALTNEFGRAGSAGAARVPGAPGAGRRAHARNAQTDRAIAIGGAHSTEAGGGLAHAAARREPGAALRRALERPETWCAVGKGERSRRQRALAFAVVGGAVRGAQALEAAQRARTIDEHLGHAAQRGWVAALGRVDDADHRQLEDRATTQGARADGDGQGLSESLIRRGVGRGRRRGPAGRGRLGRMRLRASSEQTEQAEQRGPQGRMHCARVAERARDSDAPRPHQP